MKKVLKKLGLLLACASMLFVQVYSLALAQATGCTINLYWIVGGVERDATQALPSGGNSVPVGTTYQAKVVFTNCNNPTGNIGYLRISTPSTERDEPVSINASPKSITYSVTFDAQGSFGLSARATSSSGSTIKDSAATVPITAQPAGPTPTPTPTGGVTPTPPPTGGGAVGTITNPISYDSLGALIVGIIRFLMTMLGALSVLFIIIGGVRMVTSAGNETQVKAGKSTVTWAVIGLAVALLAFSFISLLQSVLGRK